MSGCGDVVVDNQNHGYYVSEYDELTLVEKNEMIEDYALILASSMDNDELRSTIKSEAQLKFDGDYDILIQTLENKVIHEKGFVIKELLAKSHSDLNLKSGEKSGNFKSSNLTGNEYLDIIKEAFPNLQVYVPVHCDDWDTEDFIPLVVFLPYDFDETKKKIVEAYDIMRILKILFLLISLFDCNKDDPKIQILTANINGDSISFVGNAQKYSDLKNGVLFGYNYHIYNLETPNIYIEAYDSSLQANEFSFPNLSAKYAYFDSVGNSKSYNVIDGSLNIANEDDGVIYGDYYFTLLNIRDKLDTLYVKDGYFEISLEEYNREWDE